jgi:prevent-host-death family protein
MKMTNISELKNHLGEFLSYVEKGESFQIYRQNVPIARLIPCEKRKSKNRTVLGCGRGTVQVKSDLTEPMIPEIAGGSILRLKAKAG